MVFEKLCWYRERFPQKPILLAGRSRLREVERSNRFSSFISGSSQPNQENGLVMILGLIGIFPGSVNFLKSCVNFDI